MHLKVHHLRHLQSWADEERKADVLKGTPNLNSDVLVSSLHFFLVDFGLHL